MDEETIGIVGMLLIMTGLVVTHQLQSTRAFPTFRDTEWQTATAGCKPSEGRHCSFVSAR